MICNLGDSMSLRHPVSYSSVCGKFLSVAWLFDMCDMTHSCVRHDSFMCVTGFIHVCDITHQCVWRDSFMCATWLVHASDMTPSCGRHDSFICVTWLLRMCDMTPSYAWHDSFTWAVSRDSSQETNGASALHAGRCAMTHLRVGHDSFICVTWRIHMCDMTFHMWW